VVLEELALGGGQGGDAVLKEAVERLGRARAQAQLLQGGQVRAQVLEQGGHVGGCGQGLDRGQALLDLLGLLVEVRLQGRRVAVLDQRLVAQAAVQVQVGVLGGQRGGFGGGLLGALGLGRRRLGQGGGGLGLLGRGAGNRAGLLSVARPLLVGLVLLGEPLLVRVEELLVQFVDRLLLPLDRRTHLDVLCHEFLVLFVYSVPLSCFLF